MTSAATRTSRVQRTSRGGERIGFPNPEGANDRSAATPTRGAATIDQRSGTLSSNRRCAGSGSTGFVGGDVCRGCSKADTKRRKGDRRSKRHRRERGAHAGVPEAARGKIVMWPGGVVSG